MKKALVFCLLLFLAGCGAPKIVPLQDADSWKIPVTPAHVDNIVDDGETTVYVTVPPSTKPTHVEVKPKKRNLLEKALTNKPAYEVTTDNPQTTAQQPKKTLWWRWVSVIVAGACILGGAWMAFVRKLSELSPWGCVLAFIGWIRKKIKRG